MVDLANEPVARCEWMPRETCPHLDKSFTRSVGLYNEHSYTFRHDLQNDRRLQLESLIDLAGRLPEKNAYWSNGNVNAADSWTMGTAERRSLAWTLHHIETSNSLVMLKGVINDPVLGSVMRDVHLELLDRVGAPLREDVIIARATIIIASPRRVTPYHMDDDTNFLMQIAGSKQFNVADAMGGRFADRGEVAAFFEGNANGAAFSRRAEESAAHYHFSAGSGVHVPPLTPHWAVNGDEVSIAISFNYDLCSIERLKLGYKIADKLRWLGFRDHREDEGDDAAPSTLQQWGPRLLVNMGSGLKRIMMSRSAGWRPPLA